MSQRENLSFNRMHVSRTLMRNNTKNPAKRVFLCMENLFFYTDAPGKCVIQGVPVILAHHIRYNFCRIVFG